MDRKFAHRVQCPSCGVPARLTVLYSEDGRAAGMLFSCRNQGDGMHRPLSTAAMQDLLPQGVQLPRWDTTGHLQSV